ncbi:hypothetical protein REPUB_Repub07fG0059500 [Reevesia pubescens]
MATIDQNRWLKISNDIGMGNGMDGATLGCLASIGDELSKGHNKWKQATRCKGQGKGRGKHLAVTSTSISKKMAQSFDPACLDLEEVVAKKNMEAIIECDGNKVI